MTYVVSVLLLSKLDAGIEQVHNHLISIVFIAIPPQHIDITVNVYNNLILLCFYSENHASYLMHAAGMLCYPKGLLNQFVHSNGLRDFLVKEGDGFSAIRLTARLTENYVLGRLFENVQMQGFRNPEE
jgi:hypothetical protein